MSDDPRKKRMERAKHKAEADLIHMGYCVVRSDNRKACLIGFSSVDIRVVRVVLDALVPDDRKALASIDAPAVCKRELWVRKSGAYEFDKHRV